MESTVWGLSALVLFMLTGTSLFGLVFRLRIFLKRRLLALAGLAILLLVGFPVLDRFIPPEIARASAERKRARASQTASDGPSDALVLVMAEKSVKARLKDPLSANFRNVAVRSRSGIKAACGEVNSRNGFGGYAGYTRFISFGAEGDAVLESEGGNFSDTWRSLCSETPTAAIAEPEG